MPRRPVALLAVAAGCAGLAALLYLAVVHVAAVQRADVHTFAGFTELRGARTWRVATAIAELCDPLPFGVLVAAVLGFGLARGRGRASAAAAVLLLGAALTTQALKPLLAVPRAQVTGYGLDPASWPSGHTTAAMSLALALVLVFPARLRPPAAAAGGVFTVAVVYSILVLGRHYPSDVLGGLLVAAGWASLAAAGARAVERRPAAAGRAALPSAAAGAGMAVVAALVAARRPNGALEYAAEHTTFVTGAAVIAVAPLALAGVAAAIGAGRD